MKSNPTPSPKQKVHWFCKLFGHEMNQWFDGKIYCIKCTRKNMIASTFSITLPPPLKRKKK